MRTKIKQAKSNFFSLESWFLSLGSNVVYFFFLSFCGFVVAVFFFFSALLLQRNWFRMPIPGKLFLHVGCWDRTFNPLPHAGLSPSWMGRTKKKKTKSQDKQEFFAGLTCHPWHSSTFFFPRAYLFASTSSQNKGLFRHETRELFVDISLISMFLSILTFAKKKNTTAKTS